MDEKKYKLICVRKGKTNYARTNNRKNVTLGSYITYILKRLNFRIPRNSFLPHLHVSGGFEDRGITQ